MRAFVDCLRLHLQAGHGGGGAVSFYSQRNQSRGAADGGDGGNGGNVRLLCRANLKTLSHFHHGKLYRAENGIAGSKSNCYGRRGVDLLLEVPPGTVLSRIGDNKLTVELNHPGEGLLLLRGGRGGCGNAHFSSSRMRSPRFSQPGEEGEGGEFQLELKLLADLALVGFPNSGKSYLQNNLTNGRPKVAEYPFSTTVPNLGVLKIYDRDVVLADIPGLLPGAAAGVGLGQRFLAHIARATRLVLLVDLSAPDFLQQPERLLHELRGFSPVLSEKCALIIGTKTDLPHAESNLLLLQQHWNQCPVLGISNVTRDGIDQLKKQFFKLVESASATELATENASEQPFIAEELVDRTPKISPSPSVTDRPCD